MWSRIPKFFKSFYFLVSLSFLIWMIFFDPNDFISQYQMRGKLKDLEDGKLYYQEKIVEVEQEREALLKDDKKLERFARENYLMKKPSEDVYVIVEKKEGQ
ncbi:MAG TPA: septum formation initiator family protein [Cytophagaceae bacterium]|jgi:cell division protein DivIC|nr:septum formation initiator family protein [Cytophagaceae bacterium]